MHRLMGTSLWAGEDTSRTPCHSLAFSSSLMEITLSDLPTGSSCSSAMVLAASVHPVAVSVASGVDVSGACGAAETMAANFDGIGKF